MAKAKTISDQLRDAIKANGVLARTAERVGVDHGMLYRFVSGGRGLRLDTIDKIGETLGIRLETGRPAKGRKATPAKRTPSKAKATTPGDGAA